MADGITRLVQQVEALDDPLKALADDLLKAMAAGDTRNAQIILTKIRGLVAGGTELRLQDCVDASRLIEEEPPEPDQILNDTADTGDKVAIIGSSKTRKSFFMLQLALCLAAGRDFLMWTIPKMRRVLLIQFELKADHVHRRVRRMARALGIHAEDIEGSFKILNARGLGIKGQQGIGRIGELADEWKPEIILFDPLYKVAEGDENLARDFKIILSSFDALAEQTGATIGYVHHDAKGFAGDKDIRDRGAGSNTLGRDYDAAITLTPHASEPDGLVVEVLVRNYRPQEPFTIVWRADQETGWYRFESRSDIVAVKKTSKNQTSNLPAIDTYRESALALVRDKPLLVGSFKEKVYGMAGMTYKRVDELFNSLTEGPRPALEIYEQRGRGKHLKWVGLPAAIENLRKGLLE